MCAVLWASAAAAETPPPTPPVAAPGGPPSLDAYLADPVFSDAVLSPDGRFLAIVQTDAVSAVLVTDLSAHKTIPVMALMKKGATIKGLSVDWIEWKSNDRLLLGMTLFDVEREGGRPDGDIISWRYGRFIVAMDRDGKNAVQLLKGGFWNSDRGVNVSLLDRLRKDPDHILAVAPKVGGDPAVWKVNINTGEAQLIESGDDSTVAWRTDVDGDVVARYRASSSGVWIDGRAPGQTNWTNIVRLRPKDLKSLDDFEILGATDKPAQLYVAVKPKDKSEGDMRTLHVYDLVSKTLGPTVWPALKYDIDDIVTDDETNTLTGVCYTIDVYTCDFKDAEVTKNFRAISKYFGGDRNITPISETQDARWWLFSVSGPDEPETYYLFDWTTKEIEPIAERYKDLAPESLAQMRRWSYPARDGLVIPAYLSRPPKAPAGPLPLIVLPHGGPEARDTFSYDVWSQYLATRGYLVFQPNFRGSGGFGVSFAEAGYGQWGGRMADDITDGVRQLIATGQADPKRICIFGASYGGYAALYAGATHPELYKCVVSWAGLSDLEADMKYEQSYAGKDSSRYQYWLRSIGDPDKQPDDLKKASAITYAATYGPPVLLIHGDQDTNVPTDQSHRMERALKKAGKDVKLIIVKNEDHSGWDTDHEKAALQAVADFIEAHIAPATPAPAASAPVPAAPTAAAVSAH